VNAPAALSIVFGGPGAIAGPVISSVDAGRRKVRFRNIALSAALALVFALTARATIYSNVRGIVHDPQHRPVGGATVTLKARTSDWAKTQQTNPDGSFDFAAVPLGEYTLSFAAPDFKRAETNLTVASGSAPVLHFSLQLAAMKQTVEVRERPESVATQTAASAVMVSREQVERTPGADRSNSLTLITSFVPSASVSHNLLHVRGGHMVSWWVDGIPVPNLNIAANVAPQFDPKDVDYLEMRRGGVSAEYGERTFAVINVVTRSGFERNNEGELVTSYGNHHTTHNQLSFGSHTERFAYYASLNGNRSDLGLETPGPERLHDQASGLGGFTSLIFNASPADQLRFVASFRNDHFQIPNTPEEQAGGIRDLDRERDAFANFSWVRTLGPGTLLTLAPFYHFNRAAYEGGPGDMPSIPDHRRASQYAGFQGALAATVGNHNARVGGLALGQHENDTFGLTATDGSGLALRENQRVWGKLAAAYFEDEYKLSRWLTLTGGVRLTRFSGLLTETAASPRLGAALRLPRLGWILHGTYARFYQPPPLTTVTGPLLELALASGLDFVPLRGERDEQHEFGLTIPWRAWTIDVSNFRMGSRNYFDHDVLENSSVFLPITLERARIRGWEASVRSPRLFRRAQFHLAYSRQFVEAQGGVTGGLTDFEPPETGDYYFLDFDQRHTLGTGFDISLPRRSWTSANVSYGSGFLDGDGPSHLPANTTLDLAVGKQVGERWSVQAYALNVANRRFFIDRSNEFAGTHYAAPRQFALELRYRFHY
jgi:outer membrane receptor for ferrienterochelin and colicin